MNQVSRRGDEEDTRMMRKIMYDDRTDPPLAAASTIVSSRREAARDVLMITLEYFPIPKISFVSPSFPWIHHYQYENPCSFSRIYIPVYDFFFSRTALCVYGKGVHMGELIVRRTSPSGLGPDTIRHLFTFSFSLGRRESQQWRVSLFFSKRHKASKLVYAVSGIYVCRRAIQLYSPACHVSFPDVRTRHHICRFWYGTSTLTPVVNAVYGPLDICIQHSSRIRLAFHLYLELEHDSNAYNFSIIPFDHL